MTGKAIVLVAALCTLGLGSGCASRALTSANAGGILLKLEPSEYEVLKTVQGKDCTARVLGMTFNNPDLLVAEINAMKPVSGAELLVNKHVYLQEETIVPMVFGNECFFVEGIAVRIR